MNMAIDAKKVAALYGGFKGKMLVLGRKVIWLLKLQRVVRDGNWA